MKYDLQAVKVRDFQRSKLYKAEEVLKPLSANFKTLTEMAGFVDHVCHRTWLCGPVPLPGIEVKLGRRDLRRGFALIDSGIVKMPPLCRDLWSEYYLLHELAHHACARGFRVKDHGPEFAGCYVALVRENMGFVAAQRLEESFDVKGIKWLPYL